MVATAGLSLDQAPPIHLPLRLFLTAPWLAAGAGLILAWDGEAIMASRWTPAALAVTHLLAIGFTGQVMCGALLQLLPVIAGRRVPGVGPIATATHGLLTLGSLLMALGLLGLGKPLLGVGAGAASLGFAVFLSGAAVALARAQGPAPSRLALRLAALALSLTFSLGLLLTATLMGWLHLPRFPDWVQVLVFWGVLGWVGLLIVGVAYLVVPLFYVTPVYPGWMTPVLVPGLFLSITAATWLVATGPVAWAAGPYALVALGFAAFSLWTIRLQVKRARPRLDATLVHWWLALGSALAAALAWWLQAPAELLGVLLLVGVGVGLPSGMLL